MMEFELLTLDKMGFIGRGKSKHRPRNEKSLFGGAYPFIQTSDVKHSNFYITDFSQTYNEKGLAQSKLWKKGTLCITIAANIADTGILGLDACFPDSIIGFVPNEEKVNVFFVKYYLDTIKVTMQNMSLGTAQNNLSLDKLLRIKIKLPPLPIQTKIANILSTYDNLIENNQKRITILEKMAQNIYKEWFVRFRFPGWEDVEFVDGLPKEWKEVKLHTVASLIKRGITPSYHENGDSLVINQRCIRNNGLNILVARKQTKKIPDEKKVQFGDVLVNSTGTGTLGRVTQVMKELPLCTVDSHVTIVRKSKDINIDYWGYLLINKKPFFENLAIGATNQTELPREDIGLIEVLFPTLIIQNNFSKIIQPLRKQTVILKNKNQNLKKTRNRLLPRLLSGKLAV